MLDAPSNKHVCAACWQFSGQHWHVFLMDELIIPLVASTNDNLHICQLIELQLAKNIPN